MASEKKRVKSNCHFCYAQAYLNCGACDDCHRLVQQGRPQRVARRLLGKKVA